MGFKIKSHRKRNFNVTQKAAIKREKSQTCLSSSECEQARHSQITEIVDMTQNEITYLWFLCDMREGQAPMQLWTMKEELMAVSTVMMN